MCGVPFLQIVLSLSRPFLVRSPRQITFIRYWVLTNIGFAFTMCMYPSHSFNHLHAVRLALLKSGEAAGLEEADEGQGTKWVEGIERAATVEWAEGVVG